MVHGCLQLGQNKRRARGTWAGRAGDFRLPDFDLDVNDIVFNKDVAALRGHVEAIVARERPGSYADPDDDGCEGLFFFPNADNISAGPLNPHRVQKVVEL